MPPHGERGQPGPGCGGASCLAALFALEIWTLLLCPCIFQLLLAFGCCLWSTAYWIFREILRAPHLVRQWIHVLRGLWNNLHIFYVAVNSNPEAFTLHSAEWRSVHSRCFWLQSLSARFARWNLDIISMSASFFDSSRQFSLLSEAFVGLLFGVEALPIRDCGDVDIHTHS